MIQQLKVLWRTRTFTFFKVFPKKNVFNWLCKYACHLVNSIKKMSNQFKKNANREMWHRWVYFYYTITGHVYSFWRKTDIQLYKYNYELKISLALLLPIFHHLFGSAYLDI